MSIPTIDTPYCNSHKCYFMKIGESLDKDTNVRITVYRSPCCGSYMLRPLSVMIGIERQRGIDTE
jgi:hypothetical protein